MRVEGSKVGLRYCRLDRLKRCNACSIRRSRAGSPNAKALAPEVRCTSMMITCILSGLRRVHIPHHVVETAPHSIQHWKPKKQGLRERSCSDYLYVLPVLTANFSWRWSHPFVAILSDKKRTLYPLLLRCTLLGLL